PTVPEPRPRIADPGEALGTWLARVRRELAGVDAYRGAAQAIRARLELAAGSDQAPLRERALALRVLSAGGASGVRPRIADMEAVSADERAWLESVALADDDSAALAELRTRPPDFAA